MTIGERGNPCPHIKVLGHDNMKFYWCITGEKDKSEKQDSRYEGSIFAR